MNLKDKIAIVTGAGQGIGLGIAKRLASEGCKVVVSDINKETADAAAKEIGEGALAVKCDVSRAEEVDNLFEETKKTFGGVEILVNNAGIYPFKPFTEMAEADWDKVMNVNLKSVFLTSKAAAGVMKEGGKIVNISSIASIVGFPALSHYCASKGGVNGLTRALALELAPQGITVNVVAPGAIKTPGAASTEEIEKQTVMAIPLKRMGTPEDIAGAVAFLASNDASYVTGQVIVVDGGWTVQ